MSTKTILKKVIHQIPFKNKLYSIIKLFGVPPQSIYKHLYFKGIIRVPINSSAGFNIYHYGYEIENELFWKGIHKGWEKVSLGIWMKLIVKAEIIFDVGANTGVYSLVAKALNPNAKVYAFEPVPKVFKKLLYNFEINDYKVEAIEKALSNFNGTAYIYEPQEEHVLSVTINKNLFDPERPVNKSVVNTITLERIITDFSLTKIDLMKIDVETHEPEVLEGFGSYLERFKPTMLIEILNAEAAGRIENLVKGLGYLFFNINEDGGIRKTESLSKSDYYNFLLCNSDTAKYLKLIDQ